MCGADGRSRTACLLITNQLLYQLSYVGQNCKSSQAPHLHVIRATSIADYS